MAQLNKDQEAFAETFAGQTGLDLQVVRAWVLAEEPASQSAANQGHNWLNISAVPPGYKSAGRTNSGTGYPMFQNANQAALASAAFVQKYEPSIGAASGSGPLQQILAIVNSSWASGHYNATQASPYGTIGTNYTSVGGGRGQGRGPRGQPDDTANGQPGTGTADNGQSTIAASGKQGSMLFARCSVTNSGSKLQGLLSVLTFGEAGGHASDLNPISLSGVGCYLVDTLEWVALAVGGLLGMGVGAILLTGQSKNVTKAVGMAVAPEVEGLSVAQQAAQSRHEDRIAQGAQRIDVSRQAEGRRSQTAAERGERQSRAQQLAEEKEARIAADKAVSQPVLDARRKAEAAYLRSQANEKNAGAFRTRIDARIRRERGSLDTSDLPDSILGYQFDPSKIVNPGDDPSRMSE